MSMFCYQCQEAAGNKGCTKAGACGKTAETSNLQDLLIYALKGLAVYGEAAAQKGLLQSEDGKFLFEGLFTTITNANFDSERISDLITETIEKRNALRDRLAANGSGLETASLPHPATWQPEGSAEYASKAGTVGVLDTQDEDVRSLRELLVYGLKGVAAYGQHAAVLGHEDPEIYAKAMHALAVTTHNIDGETLTGEVLACGELAVQVMALLDKANTAAYGNPEISEVNIGVRDNPGILVSGHDLKDLDELLKQTEGTGVDVYTHSEMLPAHYYPAFKKHDHFVGNYGNAWWKQRNEFESFNGPILMTTNCITPTRESYIDRLYTTGCAGYPGAKHIPEAAAGEAKDFSALIEHAKTCEPPIEIETGKIVGGFAHAQVLALADKVIDAVKSGAVKRFVVMAGCDGRQAGRSYFTDVAETLPDDAIILTAGCAKYRYNKLDLGDIGGIPRVLDAGQCNDCYSLAVIALKLQEAFGLENINDLPLSFDVAWYEQKAVCVLLALLHLGVKGIRLGPTLPAFLSPNVAQVLVENFDIKLIGEVEADVEAMMAGN